MAEILILSAGRRVSLVRCFQHAGHPLGLRVIAADANPAMSSACHVADDTVILPHVSSENYASTLLNYCHDRDVKIVVPTIDTELPKIADLRNALGEIGTACIVSDRSLVDTCRDKRQTAEFFAQFGLESPEIFQSDAISFPSIVKPFDGSLSTGVHILRSVDDLSSAITANPRNIYCQYLDPAEFEEFTCDTYFSATGRLCCVVPRHRLEVRGGEVAKGRTEYNQIVPFLFEKLPQLNGARGCLTVQIMKHRTTAQMFLIEVNARFGGGYPLTARSGAEFHRWLIDEYVLGREVVTFNDWADRTLMLRYDDAIFLTDR